MENFNNSEKLYLVDSKLSWKAKGILTYLLELKYLNYGNECEICTNDLLKISTGGLNYLKTGIKELEDAGYLCRERVTDDSMRVRGTRYLPTENPMAGFPPVENRMLAYIIRNNNYTSKEKEKDNYTSKEKEIKRKENKRLGKIGFSTGGKSTPGSLVANKSNNKKYTETDFMAIATAKSIPEQVKPLLREYLAIRRKRGLAPNQFGLILDGLLQYTGDPQVMVDKIKHAIAGGYATIVAPWELNNNRNQKSTFDTTAEHGASQLRKVGEQVKQVISDDGETF